MPSLGVVQSSGSSSSVVLEFLLFLKEHTEADDGSVNQQATNHRHDHSLDLNQIGVSENDGKGNAHDNKETGKEAAEIQDGGAGALYKVIGVGAAAADPVGNRGKDVGGDDKQRVVDLEEGAGEDDEEEADGEDEREGDDGLEAGGRHGGGCRRLRLSYASMEKCY
jgi:hypothetical protein